jgi:putative transposase
MGNVLPPKGWYSRHYLPHCSLSGTPQFVTIRLHDSLPLQVVKGLVRETEELKTSSIERIRRIEALLDKPFGSALLQHERYAEIVREALQWRHQRDYTLHEWVIMPTHVHLLFTPLGEKALSRIVQSLKANSGARINRLRGSTEPVWYREYFDRFIRDEAHFGRTVDYIHSNPVRAGLAECARLYRWCSAYGPPRLERR